MRRWWSPILIAGAPAVALLFGLDRAPRAALGADHARSESSRILARIDSLWSASGKDSSQALIEATLPRARAARDSFLLCGLLVRQGAHLASFGDSRGSEASLREAVPLAEALGDSTGLCNAIRWLSWSVGSQGRLEEAHGLCIRLLDLARRRGNRRHQGWAMVGLAWEASQRGHGQESARHFEEAATLFRAASDPEGEIWALNGLGTALTDLGDFSGSAACFRRSAEVARSVRFTLVEAMALNNLGHLEYGLGDPGLALERFQRAGELQRRIGQRREAVTPALNVAICMMELGRLGEAERILEQCIAECASQNYVDLEGKALFQKAELRRRQGSSHEAAATYRRALALGHSQTWQNQAECLIGLSGTLASMDSAAAALDAARAGVALLRRGAMKEMEIPLGQNLGWRLLEAGRTREALTCLLATDAVGRRFGLHRQRIEPLALAARAYHVLGQPDSAISLLENASALWESERGAPLDPEWREQRGASGQMLYTELAALLMEAPASSGASATERAFDRLQVFKARTLLERMLGPGGDSDSISRPGSAGIATLKALQSDALAADELFLDFYLGPQVSILFAVTPRGCRAVRLLPGPELERRLLLYRELLTNPHGGAGAGSAAHDAAASRLGALLLGPVLDLIESSRRIIVSPDGPLNLLPLAELRVKDKDREVDSREWTRVPSATILLRLRSQPGPGSIRRATRILALAGDQGGNLSLPGARREARTLDAAYRGVITQIPTGAGGQESAENLEGYDILHLASHLETDDQYPWRSSFRLTTGDTTISLTAARVAGLRLKARLAVLSSCASAGGRVLSGEGVLGTSSALLSAGVPAVLATLWPVDDGATTGLVARFYDGLAQGKTASDALCLAQAALRAAPATRDPFYWAGFVLIGDGRVRVGLERKLNWTGILGAGLLVTLAALIVVPRLEAGRRPSSGQS